VLAGGRSRRLGQDKAQITINGVSLLQRVVNTLSVLNNDILVVTSTVNPPLDVTGPKLRIVEDIFPGKGPLGGVYTGLKASGSPQNIVVGCDMPFINLNLLTIMVDHAAGYDAVIPRVGTLVEPLHAVYSTACVEIFKRQIEADRLSIWEVLELLKIHHIEKETIESVDPAHLSFFNVNTLAELETARRLAAS